MLEVRESRNVNSVDCVWGNYISGLGRVSYVKLGNRKSDVCNLSKNIVTCIPSNYDKKELLKIFKLVGKWMRFVSETTCCVGLGTTDLKMENH